MGIGCCQTPSAAILRRRAARGSRWRSPDRSALVSTGAMTLRRSLRLRYTTQRDTLRKRTGDSRGTGVTEEPAPLESDSAPAEGVKPARGVWSIVFLCLLAITCVIVYLPSRNGPFVFDDVTNIVENPHVRMERLDLPSIWRAMVPYENRNPRPLSFLSFALNHLFGGYAPAGYHAVNIAVLLLSIPLAYLLALRLGGAWMTPGQARAAALGATAIWALHPLLTGGVSSIVQRMTSLYTLFSLASLLLFLRGRRSGHPYPAPYALAAASLLCALASKETALFTPLIAMLMLWLLPRERGGAGARAGWALLGLVAVSQAAMLIAAQYALRAQWVPAQPFSIAERLMTEGRVVLRYLDLLLPLPSRLTLDYDFRVSTSLLAPPSTLAAAALHAALIALAIRFRARRPLLAFGILGFYLLQLPEGTFMPLDLIFEHRAYFPAFFLALALMDLLLWGAGRLGVRNPGRAALVAAVALGALAGALAHQRNQLWADPLLLWQDTVAKAPGNARAHGNLGEAYLDLGYPEKAVGRLQEAIRLKPDYIVALNNLGSAYMDLGNSKQAVGYLWQAIRLKPDYVSALYNLGTAYLELGDPEKAAGFLRQAVQLKPDDVAALNNLGMAYLKLGDPEKAAGLLRQAVQLEPDNVEALNSLSTTCDTLGLLEEAAEYSRRARQIDPALARRLREQQ